ncbi:MAG: hypothetical protein GX347_07010 [Epulopiscium sp.]|nr:hypothetical protein [Candidatus Epulonipiscium sp.]
MNYYNCNKVLVVDHLSSPIYEKVIFVLKEEAMTKKPTKNMVKEAEKIIEEYVHQQFHKMDKKPKSVFLKRRDRILNWCLLGSSALLIYFLIQLYV